jgi:hydrogenase maturation protease
MSASSVRCLILACGNTLRGDDRVGPWLAAWAEERFSTEPSVHVVSRQQWTPDLAEDIARSEAVVFIDCAVDSPPGTVRVSRVQSARSATGPATHNVGADELLALSEELYSSLPRNALLLTIGAASTELGEEFTTIVKDALPQACRMLESSVRSLLDQR